MLPTLKEGDKIIISNIPYIFKKPAVGNIVAFKLKNNIFLKRIKHVKRDKYFLEGDNKIDSIDSRAFGLINKNQILGKFIIKL